MKSESAQNHTKRFRQAMSAKSLFATIAFALFCVVVLLWTIPRLPQKSQTQSAKSYKGVIELWNVEGFEGGSGSRQRWLTSRAAQFEKKNEGLFVHVTTLTETQLLDKLSQGENFDLICFSRGVGSEVQSLLQPYTESVADIRENLLSSGKINGNVLALPIYVGAYCLFARESQLPSATVDLKSVALNAVYTQKIGKKTYVLSSLICGFSNYICPISALAESGIRGKFTPDESISQYAAYESFVAGKTAVTLLGTQRDLYRLGMRENAGKIGKLVFSPLVGYTDLVQYIGLSATAGDKSLYSIRFMRYLVSEEAQKTLVNINMFSAADLSLYTSERYLACEQGLNGALVPNVFADKQSIKEQRISALSKLTSD